MDIIWGKKKALLLHIWLAGLVFIELWSWLSTYDQECIVTYTPRQGFNAIYMPNIKLEPCAKLEQTYMGFDFIYVGKKPTDNCIYFKGLGYFEIKS